jgi:hypothetical protein
MRGSLPPSRAHLRDASRSSRTWSVGCDGRGGVARRAMLTRFRQSCGGPYQACRVSLEKASVYGKAVWSWQPDAGAKLRETCFRAATGARKPGPRGERGISRQTIAQGRLGCSDHTCGSFPVLFHARGPRVWRTPGLPCALFDSEGGHAIARTLFRVARTRAFMPGAV